MDRLAKLIVATAVALFGVTSTAIAQDTHAVDQALCSLGFTAVPIRTMPSGHHLIDVTLNGRSGVFVLDTGANGSVIDQRYVSHFNVSSKGGTAMQAVGVGGGQSVAVREIEGLVIGGAPIRKNEIAIADLSYALGMLSEIAGEPIHGLIGSDVLVEHRAIIDVARPLLYIIVPDQDPAPNSNASCNSWATPTAAR